MGFAAPIIAGSIIGGGLSLASGLKQAGAQREAGRLQQEAAFASIEEQRRQFDVATELTQPRREAENEALNALRGLLGIGGEAPDIDLQGLPGFQFARDEALQATERSAAGRSGAVSGNVLAALQNRAGGVASQFFGQQVLNPLQNLALGGAAAQQGQNALQFGANIGRTGQQGAAARASGITGAAGAFGQGLAGINQAVQGGIGNALLLKFLQQPQPAGTPTPAFSGLTTGPFPTLQLGGG